MIELFQASTSPELQSQSPLYSVHNSFKLQLIFFTLHINEKPQKLNIQPGTSKFLLTTFVHEYEKICIGF